MRIHISSLGCARNLVDSEIMTGMLAAEGFTLTDDPAEAEAIVVNTCGFIESAVDEAVDTILELARHKASGTCRRLIVTGCMPERFREDTAGALPEVDAFLGTGAYDRIISAVRGDLEPGACLLPAPEAMPLQHPETARRVSTYPLAYLKITEGCNRHCTYCIIPRLRGRLRSRPMADVLSEAGALIAAGYREIVVIGQETFAYGDDLDPQVPFHMLLDAVAKLSSDTWIRVLYGSPDKTTEELIDTVARHENICSYFDIPVQHASPKVLKRMGRNYTPESLHSLFAAIRARMPEAALRTTLMVGFPGESEADFEMLQNFMAQTRFDHAGVFIYSDSEDLPAHRLSGHVSAKTARTRYERLMKLQAKISYEKNQSRVGRNFRVLVEESMEPGLHIGRTQFQAPEVDGIVYIEAEDLAIGDVVDVEMTDAFEYDLKGKLI